MTDDSELLRRFVDGGCNEAFSELVHRHVDLVFSAALRVVGGDIQLAEEVTQSVFIVLARKAPTLVAHPVLGGWLYRCAQFTAVDAIRAEQRRSTRLGAATMISNASDNAADAEWKRIGPMIDALLIELNEQDRNAIVLRYFDGRSFGEIGAALRLTEDAARMRINRALDRLRALLAKRGVRSTAAALGAALTGNGVVAAPANLAAAATSTALSAAAAFSAGTATHVTILSIMSTSKSIATIAVIAAALSLGIAVRQTMALHELRRAAPLRATAAAADGQQLTAARQTLADQDAALKSADLKLQKARAEIADLKAQRPAIRQTKPTDGVSDAVAAGLIAAREWTNAGLKTPANAYQTAMWAHREADVDALAKTFVFRPDDKIKIDELFSHLPVETREKLGSPEKMIALIFAEGTAPAAFQVVSETSQDENTTIAHIRVQRADGMLADASILFARSAAGWQMVVPANEAENQIRKITGETTP